jgi:hypothetical protein
MQTLPKCFLLPIDGTKESLRPARFLGRLYPPSEVRLILSYLSPPPPPAYSGEVAHSGELREKKRQFFEKRKEDTQTIFDQALETLVKEGFSPQFLQKHVEPKQSGVAKQTCLLGDIRKVDAIVVPRQVKTSLEDLIHSNPASALAQQCLQCPIWLTHGDIDPKQAAIYINDEHASMRIADHAGYMLSSTDAAIDLLRPAAKATLPISCRPSEAARRLEGYANAHKISSLLRASEILVDNGIAEDRIRLTLIPDRGDPVTEILSWCTLNGIGIIGLGRSRTEGILGILKTSATQKIATEFQNMAVWEA